MRRDIFNFGHTLFCYSHFTKYTFFTFFSKKICMCQKFIVPLQRQLKKIKIVNNNRD